MEMDLNQGDESLLQGKKNTVYFNLFLNYLQEMTFLFPIS